MQLESVWANQWGRGAKCIFRCTYDSKMPEDLNFSKSTPSGFMELLVDNPEVAAKLKVGAYYYVDFTPVEVKAD
jgi:hypothetical protein